MHHRSLLARALAVIVITASTYQTSLASTSIIIDMPTVGTTAQSIGTSASQNVLNIVQQGGSAATQTANMVGEAVTDVNALMNVFDEQNVSIQQNCGTATGMTLCIEHAAPTIATIAVQNITASASNLLGIVQDAGEGSHQIANLSGSALTDVNAIQEVTTNIIVNIFQECSMDTGVCVQRALPDVLTLAQQVISAAALNQIAVQQEAGSGSTQEANVDAEAEVAVAAQQFVSPRAFLYLSQLCSLDVGMCVQKALPLVQTVVEQVINAQAGNAINLTQSGGLIQDANVDASGLTLVGTQQNVLTQTEIQVIQECGVTLGLCLQVNQDGRPVFVFNDGETSTSGEFFGDVDDSVLDSEYSRTTVAQVAGGICGETRSCGMLDKLLFWLFGPEPVTVTSRPDVTGNPEDSGHRGHRTNMIGASAKFLAAQMSDIPGASFGGGEMALNAEQKSLFCSMRKTIPEGSDPAVWQWTARELSSLTGLEESFAEAMLHDEAVCPRAVAVATDKRVELMAQLTLMPADATGPLSSNPVWNACVRGEHLSWSEIQANPDRDEEGRPFTCGHYHTQDSWYHPDLGIYFTWNRFTKQLELPEGYLPSNALPSL
jgi:hypothetical protein